MNPCFELRRNPFRAPVVLWCLGWANLLLSAVLIAAMASGAFPGATP